MDSFTKLVEKCQRHSLYRDIENASWQHALTLFKYLLKEAAEQQKSVYIVSGSLNNDFYNELYSLSKDYLEKIVSHKTKREFKIIILKDEKNTDLSNNEIASFALKNGSLQFHDKQKSPHFILIGDSSYRFETDHDHTKAIANFNDKKTGKILKLIFDNLEKNAA